MKARYLLFLFLVMASALKLRANDANWDFDPYAFQYDMSVYVVLSSVDEKSITETSDYQIAAFCDEECRGIAEEKVSGDHKYVYLRIRSNRAEGETINFEVKNTTTGKIAKVKESIEFKSQQTIGYPSTPFAINALNPYSVTFVIDGVEHRSNLLFGDVINVPTETNKEGYTFVAWSPKVDETVPDYDVTYTATYTINQYTISFDTDGGSEIAPITQDYNSTVTAPADPTKIGYTFAGWNKEIPATIPAEDIIIKALWTINQYTITFDTDGGSEIAPITQDYNSTVTAPADPTKTGFTFAGWDKEIPTTIPAEGITIKALWTINQYTITFDTDDGSEIAPITQDYNSTVTAPADPTKTGYTFAGWDKEIPATIPAEDITIKALWTINQYTITFDTDGGSEIAPITQDYNTSLTAPADPTKTGYTFVGWDEEIPSTMPAEDITVKALWTINQYTITFDTDGGSEIAPITQDYNTSVTAPADPAKTGYTFAGWDKEIPATIPAEDITIKALWTINQYTITFDTDGGSEIAPITQDYNSAVTAPADPTKTGYTFAGWDKEIPATMPAENMTIKALWTINRYKLTYKVDGEVYKLYEVEYNATITPEAAPVKEGHTFSGWSEIPTTMPAYDVEINGSFSLNKYLLTYMVDGETYHQDSIAYGSTIVLIDEPVKEGETFSGWKGAPEKMPAHDVIVVGSFNANVYTLTYKVDGEVYKSVQYEYGEAITPEPAPSKEGYSFSGWSEIPSTMPANDVEVTGTFTSNQYKVTFIVDGEVVKEETLDFGTNITAPENPTKVGHTFTGWNPAVDTTVPSHDVTYTAQFTVNQYTITFDTDGGSEIAPITQDYNSTVTAPADPTKTGFTFAGWDKEIPATIPAEDITIKALWTINQYTISFDTDGGSEITPITQDYNSTVTAPTNPTKTGYTFAGWDKEIPATMPAENMTIKALWTINRYKLTYRVDGEVYKQYEVEYNATITPEAAPVKEGHTFSGWSEIPSTMPANDVEVTGTFTINKYKVTFIVDGEIVKEETLDFGSAIIAPEDPTKIGFTFIGWNPEVEETVPSHDVTYVAMFEINTYKLTYYVDGVVYKEFEVEYGSEIMPEESPIKEGYDFSGWSEIPQFMPDHDVDVYGTFMVSTGINNVKSISGEERIYDLSGNVIQHTRKGINIINGKKVLIK